MQQTIQQRAVGKRRVPYTRATPLVSVIVCLLVIAIGGRWIWNGGNPPAGAASPWEAVGGFNDEDTTLIGIQPGPATMVGCIKWCWFADVHPSSIIAYVRDHPGAPADQIFADHHVDIVGEYDGTWHTLTSWGGRLGPALNGVPINLSVSRVPKSSISARYGMRGDFMWIIGLTDDPNIASVELRFAAGQVVQQPVNQGMFVAVEPAQGFCGVRTFDRNGSVLGDAPSSSYPIFDSELIGAVCN